MDPYQNSIDESFKGVTRIDMLLSLYDRAISSIRLARDAKEAGNSSLSADKLLAAHRVILALHCGLNTEEYELAVGVAQLLHFVMMRLEQQNFDEAIYFLKKLQSSFEQIREEANALEKSGKIPPFNASPALNTVA